LIEAAFPDADGSPGFTDISDAIAAFVAFEWRSDTSPFDAHLAGKATLDPAAAEGADLFYGALGCATCHEGPFQTDHAFHAMGVAQFGPGKAERFENHSRDIGRARVTGQDADAYAFRTPSLRNVAQTAPYGHTGSHRDLAAFIADHGAPRAALGAFDRAEVALPDLPGAQDWWHLDDPEEQAALSAAIEVPDRPLQADQIEALVAFLQSLSDPKAIEGRLGIPEAVPSGLPIDR
jgi:cytochrome c peroxidase